MDWFGNAMSQMGDRLSEVGTQIGEAASKAADQVGQVASETATNVSNAASDTQKQVNTRTSMEGCVKEARRVLERFIDPEIIKADKAIPYEIMKMAKGVAFVTTVKAGFVFSGMVGTGVVLVKKPDGSWSGPSCLGTAGIGWGLQLGANVTDSVIILNDDDAIKAFAGQAQVKLGADISVAAGPIGRSASGDIRGSDKGGAACFSYSHSQGLFAGLALEGAVLVTRDSDNKLFYNKPDVTAEDILNGQVPVPAEAEAEAKGDLEMIYRLLDQMQTSSEEAKDEVSDAVEQAMAMNDDDDGPEEKVVPPTEAAPAAMQSEEAQTGPSSAAEDEPVQVS